MCIRLDNEQVTSGEQVTCSLDEMGDMFIFPCNTRVKKLLPEWHAAHLSRVHVYAMIEDTCNRVSHQAIRGTLNKLGAPESAIDWLQNGHSVRFTCTNTMYLCELLRKYNGLM